MNWMCQFVHTLLERSQTQNRVVMPCSSPDGATKINLDIPTKASDRTQLKNFPENFLNNPLYLTYQTKDKHQLFSKKRGNQTLLNNFGLLFNIKV